MPLLGAHLSVAGGLDRAVTRAGELGCETVQIFTKNANQWAAKPLSETDITTFRQAISRLGLQFPTAHDSYLINVAAPADELFQKSITALAVELSRAEQLGLAYLVMHPGAHVGSGDEAALDRAIAGLNAAMNQSQTDRVTLLIETTAGQGTTLGHRFEHLATLLAGVKQPHRYGVCLDTCHVFAAGYDLRTDETFDATMTEFDRIVGWSHLKLVHVNDSVKGLGSRVDRHAGLGLGQIGELAFRRLMTDPRFADLPLILETPKEDDAGEEQDPINLAKLRGFTTSRPKPARRSTRK